MGRVGFFVFLLVIVAANVAGGLLYCRRLDAERAQAAEAVAHSPQTALAARRAELEQLRRAVDNWERRGGMSLGEAIQLFDAAAVVWDEISLDSSAEADSAARLDVLTVRGLTGEREQLSRVDKRLQPRCRDYRRSPTRDGSFLLSCQFRLRRR